jgi:hypothetical protein
MILENVAFLTGSYHSSTVEVQYRSILNGDIKRLNNLFVDFNPTKDSVIYVDPEINLPRTKLRDYIKTTDCKLVNDFNKANTYITNLDGLKDKFEVTNYYVLKIADLPEDFFNCDWFKDFSVEDYGYKFVICQNNHVRNIITDRGDNLNVNVYDLLDYKTIYSVSDYDKYQEILKKQIVHSDVLLEKANADGLIIDEENYYQLQTMINSGDNANVMLAMELMANCQYKKSAAYLLCLFYEYRYQLEGQHTKKHVNFKSLLDYWDLYHGNMQVNVRQALELLKKKEILTLENLDILVKHMIIKDISVKSNIGYVIYDAVSFYIEDEVLNELCGGKYLIDKTDAKYN